MKIFLSVPFTSKSTPEGSIEPEYKEQIKSIMDSLRLGGHAVFCALEHAGWKMGGLTPPEEELQKDLDEISTSDLILVLLEEQVSAGVQLELGYAYALGKKINVYQIGKAAWSNVVFSNLSGNAFRPVDSIDEFVKIASTSGNL